MKILSTRDDKTRAFFNFIPSFHSPVLSFTLFLFYSSLYLQEVFEYMAEQGEENAGGENAMKLVLIRLEFHWGMYFLSVDAP